MAKKNKEKEVKVGSLVKVNIQKYKNFRGTVVAIENGMAKIEVPTYYGNHETIVIYEDVRFLKVAE